MTAQTILACTRQQILTDKYLVFKVLAAAGPFTCAEGRACSKPNSRIDNMRGRSPPRGAAAGI